MESKWIGLSITATLFKKHEQGRDFDLYPEQWAQGNVQLQKKDGTVNEKNLEKCMKILGWDGTQEGWDKDFSGIECEVWVNWSEANGKYKAKLQIASISEPRGERVEIPAERRNALFAGIAAKVEQIKHDMALRGETPKPAPDLTPPPSVEEAMGEPPVEDMPESEVPF